MEFILGGLTYPDDSVKSCVVYILVQACSKSSPNSLALPLIQNMCHYISTNLATAKSQELTINLLGMLLHAVDTKLQPLLRLEDCLNALY